MTATPEPQWFAIAVASVSAVLGGAAVMIFSAYTVLRRRFERPQSIPLVLLVFAIAGSARSITSAAVFSAMVPDHRYYDLIPGFVSAGAIHGVVWLTIVATILNLLSRQRETQRELAEKQTTMAELGIANVDQLRQDLRTVQDMIQHRLMPVVRRVGQRIDSLPGVHGQAELLMSANELQTVCESEVRGLSHRLAEPEQLKFEASARVSERSWSGLLGQVLTDPLPHFRTTLLLLAYMGVSLVWPRIGPISAIVVIASLIPTYLLATALEKFWLQRRGGVGTAWQILASYSLLVMFTAAVVSISPGMDGQPGLRQIVVADVPIAFALTYFVVALINGAVRGEHQATAELTQATAELEQKVAAVNRERNRIREVLSSLLHGPIQGGLSAVALALTAHAQRPDQTADLLAQARAQLERVEGQLRGLMRADAASELIRDKSSGDLAELMGQAADEWLGLISVDFKLGSGSAAAAEKSGLAQDVEAAFRECLLNSARHGRARNVQVELTLEPRGKLQLKVVDDGRVSAREPLSEGLGGRGIRDAGGQRDIRSTDQGTVVEITWPLRQLVR